MAREKELWSWLSKARLYYKMKLHIHRIENSVSPGMPDVEGFLKESTFGQFWFELKTAARPAREGTPIRFKMRPKQVEWARRRWLIGGRCYWLLQVGHGGTRQIYMLQGDEGAAIQKGLTERDLRERDIMRHHFEGRTPEQFVLRAANGGTR